MADVKGPTPEAPRDWVLIALVAGVAVLGWPLSWERQILQGVVLVALLGRVSLTSFRAGRVWTLQAIDRDRGKTERNEN